MKKVQIAKSEEGFRVLSDWYDRFYDHLPFPRETTRIDTSFGSTEVIVTGPSDAPPVVVLHGAMAGAPFALGELCDVPARYRMIGINIPGQSTRAEQVRLDFAGDEYGRWLVEVLDALQLETVIVTGVSWGGSVALQLARHAPKRIAGLLLVVPASIVSGSAWEGFVKMGLPMMRFSLSPTEKNRDRLLEHLLTSPDPLWTPYLGDAMRHYRTDFRVPPLMTIEDLRELTAPVYVIAADNDLSFPGAKLLERSSEIFSNLVGTHLLENTRHTPSFRDEDRQTFSQLFEQAIERLRS